MANDEPVASRTRSQTVASEPIAARTRQALESSPKMSAFADVKDHKILNVTEKYPWYFPWYLVVVVLITLTVLKSD